MSSPARPTQLDTCSTRGKSAIPVARIPLGTFPLVIGRAGADLILDSPVVSLRHAILERSPQAMRVRDLGSTNGTFVGSRRIREEPLSTGSVFRVGPFLLQVEDAFLTVLDTRGAFRVDAIGLEKRVRGRKTILRDVSLSVLPGELVALVGGSGAGKSTLMRMLAGQTEISAGSVFFNGDNTASFFDQYRSLIGYVPQDDIVHRELPVRRALSYAARLRLPGDTSRAEVRARIDRALAAVGLLEHAHKKISQLSGGQRKRVSIAVELIADPGLFFLDEPTSGLDPGLEKRMMLSLRAMADAGRTVVVVTHATQSLELCHQVGFLAEGRLVYFGPPAQALAFFGVASGQFADIYSRVEGAADPSRPQGEGVAQFLALEMAEVSRSRGRSPWPRLADLWELRFRKSELYRGLVTSRLAQSPKDVQRTVRTRPTPPKASSLRQLWILSIRYLELLFRDKKNLALLLLQAPLIAWLITLVAKPNALVGKGANAYDAKVVLFMIATVAIWFGVINSVREITKERVILRRERLAGLRLFPYLLSKLTVLGLLVVAQSATLVAILGTSVTLPQRGVLVQGPYELWLTTVIAGLSALALGLLISAGAKTPDRAVSAVPLVLIPQILFSGVLFPLGQDLSTIRMLSWVTASRWATDAYGATARLTAFPPLRAAREYAPTVDNLSEKWGTLGGFGAVCLGVAIVLLTLRPADE